jgi:hypothetical protein
MKPLLLITIVLLSVRFAAAQYVSPPPRRYSAPPPRYLPPQIHLPPQTYAPRTVYVPPPPVFRPQPSYYNPPPQYSTRTANSTPQYIIPAPQRSNPPPQVLRTAPGTAFPKPVAPSSNTIQPQVSTRTANSTPQYILPPLHTNQPQPAYSTAPVLRTAPGPAFPKPVTPPAPSNNATSSKPTGKPIDYSNAVPPVRPPLTPFPTTYPKGVSPLSDAEKWIIDHESQDLTTAGKKDHFFGLGQLRLDNRETYGKMLHIDPNSTNYWDQVALMRAYIKSRYGTADAAEAAWIKHYREDLQSGEKARPPGWY